MSPGSVASSRRVGQEDDKDRQIVIVDGGFASQLGCHVDRAIDGDVLWSARFLATEPEAVITTHLDFLLAGADVIETNTYQASIGGFVEHLHLSEEDSYNLIKKSVELAKEARNRFQKDYPELLNKPLIAGSVGPYGASLHDASEYTGSYAATTTAETMRAWHKPRIDALVEAGVDILAMETIPCKAEADVLIELLKKYPAMKAWISFSCQEDGKSIAFGENFQQTARKCYDLNPQQLVAVGVNCLAPRLVETLFSGLNKGRENRPVPLIVYPNSGESYNVDQGDNFRWINRDRCEPVETYVHKWLDLGVKYIGGCCRTYAADVSRISNEVRKWRHMKGKHVLEESGTTCTLIK